MTRKLKHQSQKWNDTGSCLNKIFRKIIVVSGVLALVCQPAFGQSAAKDLEAWLLKSSSKKKVKSSINPKTLKTAGQAKPLLKNQRRLTKPSLAKVQQSKKVQKRKTTSKVRPQKKEKQWIVDKNFSVRDMFMSKFSPKPLKRAVSRKTLNAASKNSQSIKFSKLNKKTGLARKKGHRAFAKKPVSPVRKSLAKALPQQKTSKTVQNPLAEAPVAKTAVGSVPSLAARPIAQLAQADMKPASSLNLPSTIDAVKPSSKDVLTNALNIVNRRGGDVALGRRPGSPQKLAGTTKTFVDRTLNPNLAFHFNDREAEYTKVDIQFVDDRSNAGLGQVYPIGGVHVHLVGSDLKMAADANGKIQLTSMPMNSRFFLRVEDPSGRIASRLVEVKAAAGLQRVNLYRKNQMQVLMQAAAVKPFAGTGNLCGVVRRRGINLDSVAVALNAQFDGPFYFDRSGVLDPRMRVTGSNGLFCMFNVDPGIKLISLFQGSSHLVDLPTTFQAHSSSFKELDIAGVGGLRLAARTVASTSSHLPVYNGANGDVDMIPLGYSLPFNADQRGVFSSTYEVVRMEGRVRLFSRGSDIEPAIYTMEKEDTSFVADILPRGFMEDLALKSQSTIQKGFGSLFGRYGYFAGETDQVTAELYDEKGSRIESVSSSSAIDKDHEQFSFFNLRPGQYMVVLKDKGGDWLQAETALVYADATSVLGLGSKTTFQ